MLGIPMRSKKLEDLELRPSNDPFITDTMVMLENGRVLKKLLKRIREDDDIFDIHWRGYILDCLYTSKLNWEDLGLAYRHSKVEHSNDEKEGCAGNDKEMLRKAGTSWRV
ncbi:hypothetical protein Tco_0825291 [Tanacetum coccineum]